MTTKIGPKEQRLREMREETARRTKQNEALVKGKVKAKAIGRVVSIKARRGARGQ